jgi:hypothetical protein
VVASITVAVEGESDEAVIRAIAAVVGLQIAAVHGKRGKDHLNKQLRAYNHAAAVSPWLVVRDLDADAPCPGELLAALLPAPSRGMTCRIAVRAVESWLLADRGSIATFLGVAETLIPADVDAIPDPKGFVVDLARRSRHRHIRSGIAPDAGAPNRVGREYNGMIIEYVLRHWRPLQAQLCSRSLQRCVARLQAVAAAHTPTAPRGRSRTRRRP